MNAVLFRDSEGVHAVLTAQNRVKRDGKTRTLCARRVGAEMQHLAPHSDPLRAVPISCRRCERSFTGFVDVMETDFGYDQSKMADWR